MRHNKQTVVGDWVTKFVTSREQRLVQYPKRRRAQAVVRAKRFNLDRFGEITVSAGNQTQPTQLFDAQTEQADVQALMERVGAAEPADGAAFLSLTRDELDANSEMFSPSAYLAELQNSMQEGENDEQQHLCRCQICFGDYDATDTSDSLRKLSNCGHVFHTACVETWLRTAKSSCPLCKTPVRPEG